MQDSLGEFAARGVHVVAISVDRPEVTREHCRRLGYTYTFLSDANREVIRRYDLLHVHGGPKGDIARPTEFLIDSTGTIRWRYFSQDYRVRIRPEQIFQVLDELARHGGLARRDWLGRIASATRAALSAGWIGWTWPGRG